jgi:hypothetical protein
MYSGEQTGYPCYRKLGGPHGRSGRVRKSSLLRGFDPLTSQPVAIRYTGPQFPVINNPFVRLHEDFDALKNENSSFLKASLVNRPLVSTIEHGWGEFPVKCFFSHRWGYEPSRAKCSTIVSRMSVLVRILSTLVRKLGCTTPERLSSPSCGCPFMA